MKARNTHSMRAAEPAERAGRPSLLICPLTSPTIDAMRVAMVEALSRGADVVECRLDFLTNPPSRQELARLIADKGERIIATCRPQREGGRFTGPEPQRLEILRHAAELGCCYVDMEQDVPPSNWPKARIILSHHDFSNPGAPADLDVTAARMEASSAAINKVAFLAAGPEDALRALDVLRQCRKPTLALAMEEAGVISRILARKFGAFGTFAALDRDSQSAPGQPTLADFRNLYRWDSLNSATTVYGVIGCPVAHSMSPAIHNAAFTAAGLDAVYVPLLIQPGAEDFCRFMDALLARPWMDWRGLSVTIPHKENALRYVGQANCDPLAQQIGAINTITIGSGGTLRGDNTDYAAAIDSLCQAMGIGRTDLGGKTVALLGAGGAARAILTALTYYGANVTVYNRTLPRAEALAEEFACSAATLDDAARCEAQIIINCTSVGMSPRVDESPLAEIPRSARIVFDTVYNPVHTRLLSQASEAGCVTISGLEMFVNQAAAQYEIWTGSAAPREVMREVVLRRLGAR